MTGALLRVDIRGKDGAAPPGRVGGRPPHLPRASGVHGFPNLFTITGPGSPSVLTNMLVSIQQHVEWIADCITYLREHGHATIEAEQQAQDELGRLRQHGRRLHALPHLQLLVPRGQRAREDPGVHAPARLRHLRGAVRLRRRRRATRASRWPRHRRAADHPALPAGRRRRPLRHLPAHGRRRRGRHRRSSRTRSCSATCSSSPYAVLEPEHAFVRRRRHGPGRRATSSARSTRRAFEARCEAEWWPAGPGPPRRPGRRDGHRRALPRRASTARPAPPRRWWRPTRRTSTSTCCRRAGPAAGARRLDGDALRRAPGRRLAAACTSAWPRPTSGRIGLLRPPRHDASSARRRLHPHVRARRCRASRRRRAHPGRRARRPPPPRSAYSGHDVEGPLVGAGQHDRGGHAGVVGPHPVDGRDAPAVARARARGSGTAGTGVLRSLPMLALVLEELGGDHRADRVAARGPRGRCCSSRRGRSR